MLRRVHFIDRPSFPDDLFTDVDSAQLRMALRNLQAAARAVTGAMRDMYAFPDGGDLKVGVTPETHLNARARQSRVGGPFSIEFTSGYVLWAAVVSSVLARMVASGFRLERTVSLSFRDFAEDVATSGVQTCVDLTINEIGPDIEGSWLFFFESLYLPVLFHELAHVVRGHLGLLRQRHGGAGLCMVDELMSQDAGNTPPGFPLRDVEIDADVYCSGLSGEFAFARSATLPRWQYMTGKENLYAEFVGYALFVVGQERMARDRIGTRDTYPSPNLRLLLHSVAHRARWNVEHPESDYFAEIFEPAMELLAPLEPAFPELDLLRDTITREGEADLRKEIAAYFDQDPETEDGLFARFAFDARWSDPIPKFFGIS